MWIQCYASLTSVLVGKYLQHTNHFLEYIMATIATGYKHALLGNLRCSIPMQSSQDKVATAGQRRLIHVPLHCIVHQSSPGPFMHQLLHKPFTGLSWANCCSPITRCKLAGTNPHNTLCPSTPDKLQNHVASTTKPGVIAAPLTPENTLIHANFVEEVTLHPTCPCLLRK